MGVERQVRRKNMIKNMKLNGMRTRCRKCGARMTVKSGYGWTCPACGYVSEKQKEAAESGNEG